MVRFRSLVLSVIALTCLVGGAFPQPATEAAETGSPGAPPALPLSPDPGSDNVLYSVSAVSPTDAWAVGSYVTKTTGVFHTMILHWNGAAWSRVKGPSNDNLFSVSATSPTDAWAVGYYQSTTGVLRNVILHWNGLVWSRFKSPSPSSISNYLSGVSAHSATDAWAAGVYENDANGVHRTLILHWNGTAWSRIKSPNPSSVNNFLASVSASSANDAWAVGSQVDAVTRNNRTLILHWDGTAWSRVKSPSPSSSNNLPSGVSADSATDAWVVGNYVSDTTGYFRTLILHWDGTVWSRIKSPNPSSSHNILVGVSAVSATDAWAVGIYVNTTTVLDRALILHWNGAVWSRVKSPNPDAGHKTLSGVSADSATDAWAVGSFVGATTGKDRTLISHWDGAVWSRT